MAELASANKDALNFKDKSIYYLTHSRIKEWQLLGLIVYNFSKLYFKKFIFLTIINETLHIKRENMDLGFPGFVIFFLKKLHIDKSC
jgi:hypothetical protein